ncbi:unnamed protein product [Trichogramma brassicae]|uniref:MYND-type domain-containing protein n=1 Tax=Trichogramma brassicae TaxID=86971 RepID=A0A6H5ISJ1_9HYME|nr:unnamed protein product [Trichogramma brassicae]
MYKSKTGCSKPRLPFWNDRSRRFDKLPQVVRDEMNSAMELTDLITEKSTEVTTICRGFAKTRNPLYREVAHDSLFHAICFEWAGRCLAYARPRSLEYVQGLLARADLHYHCGNWAECRLDAREALDQMKCYNLKDQLGTVKLLVELLAKAEAKAGERPPRPQPHPSMNNYEPLDLENQKPPNDGCLFQGVKPTYSVEWGRHLVATRDIKVGEMILVEDVACCVLAEEAVHTNCSHCGAQAWRGVACDHCVYALYCSEQCRAQAWSEYHEIECQICEVVNRRFDRIECQAALRLLVKFLKMQGAEHAMKFSDVFEYHSATLYQTDPLDKGFSDHREKSKDMTDSAATLLWYYCLLDRAGEKEDAEMLLDQAGITFEFLDYEDEVDDALLGVVLASLKRDDSVDKGIGDDSTMKIFVRKIFRKMKRVFQVNSHWITVNYSHMMNFTLNAATRRLDLAWERKFICYCQGCVEDWLPKSPRVSFEVDVGPEGFFFYNDSIFGRLLAKQCRPVFVTPPGWSTCPATIANVIAVRHAHTDVLYTRLFYNIIRLVLARTLYSCRCRWPAAMSNAKSIRTAYANIESRTPLYFNSLTRLLLKNIALQMEMCISRYVREQEHILIENHLRNKKDAAGKRRENIMRTAQSDKTLLHPPDDDDDGDRRIRFLSLSHPCIYAYIYEYGFRIQKHDDDDDDAGEEDDEARIRTVALSRLKTNITMMITFTYHERGRAEWRAGAPVSRVERRPSRWPGSHARVDPPRVARVWTCMQCNAHKLTHTHTHPNCAHVFKDHFTGNNWQSVMYQMQETIQRPFTAQRSHLRLDILRGPSVLVEYFHVGRGVAQAQSISSSAKALDDPQRTRRRLAEADITVSPFANAHVELTLGEENEVGQIGATIQE